MMPLESIYLQFYYMWFTSSEMINYTCGYGSPAGCQGKQSWESQFQNHIVYWY